MQLHETEFGRRFFGTQPPKMIKALERIADALEKQQNPVEEQAKEILLGIHKIGGFDDTDAYSRGWDNAITVALSKVEEITGVSVEDVLE